MVLIKKYNKKYFNKWNNFIDSSNNGTIFQKKKCFLIKKQQKTTRNNQNIQKIQNNFHNIFLYIIHSIKAVNIAIKYF